MTRMNTRMNGGLFGAGGVQRYEQKLLKAKIQAYKKGFTQAKLDTRKELTSQARGVFNVKSKTFPQMFTGSKYDKNTSKMPTALFYTRSHYWNIYETGANIGPKKAQGLFIPFIGMNNRNKGLNNGKMGKKAEFFKMLEKLKAEKKTFWKKVGSKLILFVTLDKENRNGLRKFRKLYATRKNFKSVKSGTRIPVGILVKSVRIKKRFEFSNIAKNTFVPNIIKSFENNIDLSNI